MHTHNLTYTHWAFFLFKLFQILFFDNPQNALWYYNSSTLASASSFSSSSFYILHSAIHIMWTLFFDLYSLLSVMYVPVYVLSFVHSNFLKRKELKLLIFFRVHFSKNICRSILFDFGLRESRSFYCMKAYSLMLICFLLDQSFFSWYIFWPQYKFYKRKCMQKMCIYIFVYI